MNEHFTPETDPILSDGLYAGDPVVGHRRRPWFSATHGWIVAGLWLAWTIFYTTLVVAHVSHPPEQLKSLLMTPLLTAIAPLLGAMLRDFQGCCLQVSLGVLSLALPIPISAAFLQWCWRPRHKLLRIVRLLFWAIAWMLWFASGILPLGHALS